jgi:hypothetical protein
VLWATGLQSQNLDLASLRPGDASFTLSLNAVWLTDPPELTLPFSELLSLNT